MGAPHVCKTIRLPGGWSLQLCAPPSTGPRWARVSAYFALMLGSLLTVLWEAGRSVVLVLLAAMFLHWFGDVSRAASIPREAQAHRSVLVRAARLEWGLGAPVATFAAQVHQESEWRPDAVSPVGAQGLAQFMPSTARWLPSVAPSLLSPSVGLEDSPTAAAQTGQPAPFNPAWALRAMVAYDLWLHQRVRAATPCDRMAMALAAYNGGLGWVQRDARLAATRGRNPIAWWSNVETVNAGRSANAFRENRGYPRRILLTLEPVYEAAGWGGGSCDG